MKLRRPNNFGAWVFFLTLTSGEEYRIPTRNYAKSLRGLIILVDAVFSNLASQGDASYLKAAQDEAKKLNLEYYAYLGVAIEHQICIRNGGTTSKICYSSGLGDSLHSVAERIDSIAERAPKPVLRVYEKVVKAVLDVPRLKGCQRCGGSRSFSSKGNNMGRAGRLNSK